MGRVVDGEGFFLRMKKRVETVLDRVRGPDVLDLGCAGVGVEGASEPSLHRKIRERYPSTWGLDASTEAVQWLRGLGWTNLHVGDAQDFELNQRFDTIVAGEILEHVERPGELLQRCLAHLKPGGQVIVTTPYVFGLHNVLYAALRFPRTCSNPEHVQWYCPTTLATLIEREGMKTLEWHLTVDYEGDPNNALVNFFYGLMRTVGRLLPTRLQATGMIFVLGPQELITGTRSSARTPADTCESTGERGAGPPGEAAPRPRQAIATRGMGAS